MSKTMMVAQREFMENMRTKTFWLGILAAPVGIALFYAVMFFLVDKADVRNYVILDHSQSAELGDAWLSRAIDEKVAKSESQKILKLLEKPKEDQQSFAEHLKKTLEELGPDHPLTELFEILKESGMVKQLEKAGGDPKKLAFADFVKLGKALAPYFKKLQADERGLKLLTNFASDLAIENFRRLPFEDQGEDSEKILNKMLLDGKVFAYFVIGPDPLDKKHGSKYVSNNVTDFKLRNWYSRHATDIIREHHVSSLRKEKNLTDEDVASIQTSFSFDEKKISETGEEEEVDAADKVLKFAPVFFVYFLWLSVFIAAQMLLTNTVEEKSNRIIEVLLSSVSPSQLMNGKIYGIALTGLTIVGSWSLFFIAGIKLAPLLIPEDLATKMAGWGLDQIVSDPVYLCSFLGYFLAGYLFYAAILVAIGSVCNSLKEAQNLQQPVVMVLMVPLATMIPIVGDPNGTLAKIITYIPFYTPFAMMNRAGGPPPTWEWIASSVMILVSIWLAFRGAARIFRVGVLMTGKPPKFKEIWRWMRAPVR